LAALVRSWERTGAAHETVGIVGFGFIGASLYRAIEKHEIDGLEVAFAYNRSPGKLGDVPAEIVLHDLSRARECRPDLIVECSHPNISIEYGADFLSHCDYMPLSVTALADDGPPRDSDSVPPARAATTCCCRAAHWWVWTDCSHGATCGET